MAGTHLIPCCIRRSSVRGYGYRTSNYQSQEEKLRVRGCCKSQETHCKAPICLRATILNICTSVHPCNRTASFIFHSLFQPRMIPHPSIPSHIFILYSLGRISAKGNLHLIHSFKHTCPGELLVLARYPCLVSSCLVPVLVQSVSCPTEITSASTYPIRLCADMGVRFPGSTEQIAATIILAD